MCAGGEIITTRPLGKLTAGGGVGVGGAMNPVLVFKKKQKKTGIKFVCCFWGVIKCDVLILVGEIPCYKNYSYYYTDIK